MHLSTVFIFSTFALAGTSVALPVEREKTIVARCAASDFPARVEARAYDEKPRLYVRGSSQSKTATDERVPLLGTPKKEQPKYDFSGLMDAGHMFPGPIGGNHEHDRPNSPSTSSKPTRPPNYSSTGTPRRRSLYGLD